MHALRDLPMLGFNPVKTKVQLKLASNRLKLVQQKKTAINQNARKEIAALLERGKEESARIRVENIIREDYNVEALELLELYVETLLARFGLLETMPHCDDGIFESVNTIIYAAPRVEIQELDFVRAQLIGKFGREFGLAAMENVDGCVNDRIVQKLKIETPPKRLVDQYLTAIAAAYHVDWEAPEDPATNPLIEPVPDLVGLPQPQQAASTTATAAEYAIPATPAALPASTIATTATTTTTPLAFNPAFDIQMMGMTMGSDMPSAPTNGMPDFPVIPAKGSAAAAAATARTTFAAAPAASAAHNADTSTSADDATPNFDELARRFEALKKRK